MESYLLALGVTDSGVRVALVRAAVQTAAADIGDPVEAVSIMRRLVASRSARVFARQRPRSPEREAEAILAFALSGAFHACPDALVDPDGEAARRLRRRQTGPLAVVPPERRSPMPVQSLRCVSPPRVLKRLSARVRPGAAVRQRA